MKEKMISALLQVLLTMLTPDLLRSFADMALDFVEEKVLGTASTVDDKLVLPLCEQLRTAFGIEDND